MRRHEPSLLIGLVLAAVVVSAIRPRSWGTWALEVTPIVLGIVVLVVTASQFRFTGLVYRALAVGALMVAWGAHYSFSDVPLGAWLQDWFGFERNHYDRVGHFVQGAVAALVIRELLIRFTRLRSGWRLTGIVTLMCLGISGGFELIEAILGTVSGQAGNAYLGTQGDPLDAQWDMACALIGAVTIQLTLARVHDQGIAGIATSSGRRSSSHPTTSATRSSRR